MAQLSNDDILSLLRGFRNRYIEEAIKESDKTNKGTDSSNNRESSNVNSLSNDKLDNLDKEEERNNRENPSNIDMSIVLNETGSGKPNKLKASRYRYTKLSLSFLRRISRKNAKSANLDSYRRRISVLGEIIKAGAILDHVYFGYLKDFSIYFGL